MRYTNLKAQHLPLLTCALHPSNPTRHGQGLHRLPLPHRPRGRGGGEEAARPRDLIRSDLDQTDFVRSAPRPARTALPLSHPGPIGLSSIICIGFGAAPIWRHWRFSIYAGSAGGQAQGGPARGGRRVIVRAAWLLSLLCSCWRPRRAGPPCQPSAQPGGCIGPAVCACGVAASLPASKLRLLCLRAAGAHRRGVTCQL